MEKPLVSILMPVYNSEEYLSDAIKSILSQSYSNWELIICDDHSSDNSYKIAVEYAKVDKRIIVVKNNKNMRQAYSRNKAFIISKGEYIAVLDSDDIMHNNRLEEQVFFLNHNLDISFVCSNAEIIDGNGMTTGYIYKKQVPSSLDVIRNKAFIYASIMVRRNVFIEVGGYTVSAITYTGEDYDLICKIYSKGYRGKNLKEFLYKCRIVDNYKRRPYKCYLNEFKVGFFHIKNNWLKINNLPCISIIFIYFPLIKGLIPQSIIKMYHMRKYRNI